MTFPIERREDARAALDRQARNRDHLARAGLYDPSQEHDACGVGLVAAIDGTPRREVIDRALEALGSIWHRGAVAADGKTGDGAGIHVQVSQAFFRDCVWRTGHTPRDGRIAVGMIFLPRTDYTAQEACRRIVETEILRAGYYIYGWRQVPINTQVIGGRANAARPEIEQILFACPEEADLEALDRNLYLVRRRIEKRAAAQGIKEFYICSLSAHSLIYKGMFLAEQLSVFYPDLADTRFVSAFAIYHQRYSTNTVPTWWLAQPFRMLAHNGEINTIRGNTNWMRSHEILMAAAVFGDRQDDIRPVISPDLSDSAALDAAFEVIVRAGRPAPMAKTMLMPEAWNDPRRPVPEAHRPMYAYTTALTEPWDGPAAIAGTDGQWVIAGMDRNGLRPMRMLRTEDGLLIVGSETGLCDIDEANIVEKGRVGPGETIAVDLEAGRLYTDRELKDHLAADHNYPALSANIRALDSDIGPGPEPRLFSGEDLRRRQRKAGLTVEDLELLLSPMAEEAKEAVGSMGDDTPLAVLSDHYRPLSHFLRQKFSQVTNPPIDPIRESRVMSLRTRFGNLRNVLTDRPFLSEVITLESPILLNGPFDRLIAMRRDLAAEIDCTFALTDGPEGPLPPGAALRKALDRIREQACTTVRAGRSLLVLSDMSGTGERVAIPMILATAAVHTILVTEGLRNHAAIIVRAAECLDTHTCAMLISCGATVVNPYLAQDSITDRVERGLHGDVSLSECLFNYKHALEQGLLKIMSKMGISVISSYRAGFNFEAVGLSRALVDEFFPDVSSRISGIGLAGLESNIRTLVNGVRADPDAPLSIGGLYRYRARGEVHALQGPLIHMLQEAVGRGDFRLFKRYSEQLGQLPPVNLRDLMDFRTDGRTSVPLDAVDSVNEIRKRFVTPGMSLGALSPEAHGVLNIAMNRIGAKSDSGEGGEDPDRFVPLPNGDNANSTIKQVASGRFGVTATYLNQCSEIEIKVAQGAKPGEGGQLPGFKVTDLIARFRHATPGVTLISPPPHHDIYSIEDLAQLIYDLKQINPDARVCVKLVATSGIGTIASGVAKAMADVILVSGNVGGTGASPQTSIKYAGIPWEMGLSEVNQVLTLHDLRHRVTLRTDGGLRTGRDVVIAALLGAEEYGIGTASLVAMGCIMVRQCHSNTCPVGVCTQDEDLRARFTGTPEKVVNLMSFIAEEVREILAELGAKSLSDIIGRTDLLYQVRRGAPHLDDLDLNPLLVQSDPGPNPRTCAIEGRRNEVPDSLDARIVRDAAPFLERGQKMQLTYTVRNTQRAIGTRVSSHIVRRLDAASLTPDRLTVQLHGSAGQSLGAFAAHGLTLEVFGEANDYVGKGLSGGTIIVRPPQDSRIRSERNTIIGNTVLYGATSGILLAAGQAGERFAVRNSGATAVIEGCGSNGCEYMTGGTAVILGSAGANFGAGMTGGMAFVLDTNEQFEVMVNPDTVVWQRIETSHWERVLRQLIEAHAKATQSSHAEALLARWDVTLPRFWQVVPKEMVSRLSHPLTVVGDTRHVS
ncbi:MAG: glutamate synthase large subunit [Alphaproteobacteria bacterium]